MVIYLFNFIQTEYQLGKRLGVDLKLKVDTDRKNPHLGSYLQDLYDHTPLSLLSLGLPLNTWSCRAQTISLYYSPSSSQTKEASFVFSLGKN